MDVKSKATTSGFPPGIQYTSGQEEPAIVCFRCGLCCTRYRVRLSHIEARRIADDLGLPWETFLHRYVDQHRYRLDSFLLRHREGVCIFLEQAKGSSKTRCLIHHCKPSACQEWTPSLYRSECREGLAKYWGLTVNPPGQLEGSEEKLRNFHTFLESLRIENGDKSAKKVKV